MTVREGIVLSAYTGFLLCDNFGLVHEYIEEILGRPVFTHEIPSLRDVIAEKSKAEMLTIITNQKDK